jgi:hypothetical protein
MTLSSEEAQLVGRVRIFFFNIQKFLVDPNLTKL